MHPGIQFPCTQIIFSNPLLQSQGLGFLFTLRLQNQVTVKKKKKKHVEVESRKTYLVC